MTRADILKSYLEYNNLRIQSGSEDSFEPLLPFLLMDIVYQIYCKWVQPMQCKHLQNHYKKEWKKHYGIFNRGFFDAFDEEQTDFIIDSMDDFEKFIHNDKVVLKNQLMKCCNFLPAEEKDFISDLLLCDILTKAAMAFWTKVYLHDNVHLVTISSNLIKFAASCYHHENDIKINNNKDVDASLRVLCNKIVKWFHQ